MNPTPAETTVLGDFRTGPTTAGIANPVGTRTEILPGDGIVGVNHQLSLVWDNQPNHPRGAGQPK